MGYSNTLADTQALRISGSKDDVIVMKMYRFEMFRPRERAVIQQALQELGEEGDPGLTPWTNIANELYREVSQECNIKERTEADLMNKEGKAYE
jgi:hypothetical protein